MWNPLRLTIFVCAFFSLLVAPTTYAQTTTTPDYQPDQYFRGTVTSIIREEANKEENTAIQHVEVKFDEVPGKSVYKEVLNMADLNIGRQRVSVGDDIVVIKVPGSADGDVYYVSDHYRLPNIVWFTVIFFVLVVALGGWRGFTSIAGLLGSIAVLGGFIIPLIVGGHSPLLVVTAGSILIVFISMFFAHGFNRATLMAISSTGITLILSSILAYLAVHLTDLSGTGTEEAIYVQFGKTGVLDLRGILLAGIIIGAVGVLDDITTAQTASVRELHDTKPDISFHELFARVMRIGREHIASLVNTLVLAYAGASFPLFLLFYSSHEQPLWSIINSQQIAEELVRTLVGSTALVLAVPISSAIAAYFYTGQHKKHRA